MSAKRADAAPAFDVLDASKGVVASGDVGGDPVRVPPGSYTVTLERGKDGTRSAKGARRAGHRRELLKPLEGGTSGSFAAPMNGREPRPTRARPQDDPAMGLGGATPQA